MVRAALPAAFQAPCGSARWRLSCRSPRQLRRPPPPSTHMHESRSSPLLLPSTGDEGRTSAALWVRWGRRRGGRWWRRHGGDGRGATVWQRDGGGDAGGDGDYSSSPSVILFLTVVALVLTAGAAPPAVGVVFIECRYSNAGTSPHLLPISADSPHLLCLSVLRRQFTAPLLPCHALTRSVMCVIWGEEREYATLRSPPHRRG
jgi:hypothetical protein